MDEDIQDCTVVEPEQNDRDWFEMTFDQCTDSERAYQRLNFND